LSQLSQSVSRILSPLLLWLKWPDRCALLLPCSRHLFRSQVRRLHGVEWVYKDVIKQRRVVKGEPRYKSSEVGARGWTWREGQETRLSCQFRPDARWVRKRQVDALLTSCRRRLSLFGVTDVVLSDLPWDASPAGVEERVRPATRSIALVCRLTQTEGERKEKGRLAFVFPREA
jgi:hypothetical protein